MSRELRVISAGPSVTVQDTGRPGYLSQGLSRGGAADPLALAEGAALLGQDGRLAALEMAGFGGVFEASAALRIALTGAPMQAQIEGAPLPWNASHMIAAGQRLRLGAVQRGVYGYLHLGGGVDAPSLLGSRSAHLTAGLGRPVAAGDSLPVGPEPPRTPPAGQCLEVADRFAGGTVRIVAGPQTGLFPEAEIARFAATTFLRDARGNRQGVRLGFDGARFAAAGQLNLLSEIIVPGDIQMTGDGTPYVLLPECQVTGGYPRIGTVLPCDLPMVAQAAPGARLRFRFVTLDEGLAAWRQSHTAEAGLPRRLRPLVRDPKDIGDLLGYQLIGGVTTGTDEMEG